jgi:hypothetical protein
MRASVTAGHLSAIPFVGPIELWTKWTSTALELNPRAIIAVEKQRWERKFDTTAPLPAEIPVNADGTPLDRRRLPPRGCNVELTAIRVAGGAVWWTFSFEALGTLQTVENDLRAVALMVAGRKPPALNSGLLASYPAWLKGYA